MKAIIPFTLVFFLLSGCFLNKTKSFPEKAAEEQERMTKENSFPKPTIITYEQTLDSNTVYSVVEKMPDFPGEQDSLFAFLIRNIKYPAEARKKETSGKVYTQFIVERNGSLSDIKVIRGIGDGCDEEAIRVIKLMPNWIPGEQREKKVRVRFILPIHFALKN